MLSDSETVVYIQFATSVETSDYPGEDKYILPVYIFRKQTLNLFTSFWSMSTIDGKQYLQIIEKVNIYCVQ